MERRDFVVINATVSKYDNLFDFHEDMGMVLYNSKFGFVNKEGREVVKPIYDDAKDYNNGYAAVKLNNSWFFINKDGEKVSSEYEFMHNFKNGYALVKKGSKWGIIDTQFKEVIPTIYDLVEYPSDGLILTLNNGTFKYVDLNNEVKIELPKFIKRAYPFKNGVARVESDSYKTGYIDINGKQITDFIYSNGSDFMGNLAAVTAKDGSTIIHKSGKELFPRTKDFTINNVLSNGNFEALLGYKKNTVINHLGAIVNKKTYTHMYSESEGMIRVQDENNNYGFIDINGNQIIPPALEYADDFSNGLAVVRDSLTHKYGYTNKYGILEIPCIYDMARSFSDNIAIVELNGNVFYIDKNNKAIKMQETKNKLIQIEALGIVPNYVIDFDMNKDFVRYKTELIESDQWESKVIITDDINDVKGHEEKVLQAESLMLDGKSNTKRLIK